jgi:hypothetical protein
MPKILFLSHPTSAQKKRTMDVDPESTDPTTTTGTRIENETAASITTNDTSLSTSTSSALQLPWVEKYRPER